MSERYYLDHNATSPLRPGVIAAMVAAMERAHNPSSVHKEGRDSKALLERARQTLSDIFSVPQDGVIFTGGGTEADNLALYGMVHGPAGIKRLFVPATEHNAVRAAANQLENIGVVVEELPIDQNGLIDLEWLAQRTASYNSDREGAFMVCVMLANNETGVINPIADIGPLVWPKGGYVFADAVQGLGKIAINFDQSGADLMAVAGHKVGGPVGTGALFLKPGLGIAPQLLGGGQESNRRAGTQNIAGIAGFVMAAELALPTDYSDLTVMRDQIEAALPDTVRIWGQGAARLPNTSCFSALGFTSESQVMVMDLLGFAISAGSACSSGKVRRSGVLHAMGADDAHAQAAVRISLGWDTPAAAAEKFTITWCTEYHKILARNAA